MIHRIISIAKILFFLGILLVLNLSFSEAAPSVEKWIPYYANCIDKTNDLITLNQTNPGQPLALAAKDPAIVERSYSVLLTHWEPLFSSDFKVVLDAQGNPTNHECGAPRGETCDPVTYSKLYHSWWQNGRKGPPPPRPSLFIYIPTHPFLVENDANGLTSREALFKEMHAIDGIPDETLRLKRMRDLIKWLKNFPTDYYGAGIGTISYTGDGSLYLPGIAFEYPTPADKGGLPKPRFAPAIAQWMAMMVRTDITFDAPYTAEFRPNPDGYYTKEAYEAFIRNTPGPIVEDLAYTDIQEIIDQHKLTKPTLVECKETGRCYNYYAVPMPELSATDKPLGYTFRGVTFYSNVSFRRDSYGRPIVWSNGEWQVERAPSGLCAEEAAWFEHNAMLHTSDGSTFTGMTSGNSFKEYAQNMNDLFLESGGWCEQWNNSYKEVPSAEGVQDHSLGCVKSMVHGVVHDIHLFVPRGNIAGVKKRLAQLTVSPNNPLQKPEDWAKIGYVVPATYPKGEFSLKNTRIRSKYECLALVDAKNRENCLNNLAQVFYAPYTGITTRLNSSLAEQHDTPQVRKIFDDPLVESFWEGGADVSFAASIRCRYNMPKQKNFNRVGIENPDCDYRAHDSTPIPHPSNSPNYPIYNELISWFFNHTWLYGSMVSVFDTERNYYLPRYWSSDATRYDSEASGHQNLLDLMGMLSHRFFFSPDIETYPSYGREGEETAYNDLLGARWFVEDENGFFKEVLVGYGVAIYAYYKNSSRKHLRLELINRQCRGDTLYCLRYKPQMFLFPPKNGSFNYGTNYPNAFYPIPEKIE